jgi:hypothetical protein
MYVDLNPVRAAMAETPEKSQHSSAYDRIKALQGATIPSAAMESSFGFDLATALTGGFRWGMRNYDEITHVAWVALGSRSLR